MTDLLEVIEPRFWISPGGLRLAWAEYGDPAGRPVFFYHGWPASRLEAALVHRPALERGLRVLAIDRPGMGRSDFMPDRVLGDWPRLLEKFADAHGIGRFGQLAVSGGGPYALACAHALPDRLSGSAVLCGAVPLAGGGIRRMNRPYRVLAALRWLPASCFTLLFRGASRGVAGDLGRPSIRRLLDGLPAADRDLLLESPEVFQVIAGSFREGVRQGGGGPLADAGIYFQDWGIPLGEIRHPIHYWHGGQDLHIPVELAREFVAGISGAVWRFFPEEGHFSLAIRQARAAVDHLADCES